MIDMKGASVFNQQGKYKFNYFLLCSSELFVKYDNVLLLFASTPVSKGF